MKARPTASIILAAAVLAAMACSVATNTDIREAAFPDADGDGPSSTISILDDTAASLANDGAAYDFGYLSGSSITKTFTIENIGSSDLRIFGVSSNNESAMEVTDSPAPNTLIAPGGTVTFDVLLKSAVMETLSSAVVTVTSDSGDAAEYELNLVGGGPTITFGLDDDVGYKLSGHGYDFAYAASQTDRTLVLRNSGTAPVNVPFASVAVNPSARFTAQSISAETLAPGASTNLVVRYAPDAAEYSEAELTLTSAKGRTYTVTLSGSGFPQPDDLSGLALWLRADRIRTGDVTYSLGNYYVDSLPDLGSGGYDATDEYPDSRPRYVADGPGSKPALLFDGYDDCLVSRPSSGNILNVGTAGAYTVFIACETGGTIVNRYLLWPSSSTGWSYGYPRLYLQSWSWDPSDGASPWSNSGIRFYQYGYNDTGYPSDSAAQQVAINTDYALGFTADFSVASPTTNVVMWINGTQKTLTDLDTYGNQTGTTWMSNAGGYNTIMRQLAVGYFNGSGYSNTFNGHVSEVILFNRKLTAQEISDMNDYLMTKYAISP